jgi:hypothetical protein
MNIYGLDPTLARLLGAAGLDAPPPARSAVLPFGPTPAWRPSAAPSFEAQARSGLIDSVGAFGRETSILDDPTLTVVDKLILLLQFVEERTEQQANAQMKEIEASNQQGGSLEVAATRLKRTLDTASQIKDIIRGAIAKYTESENNAAQSVGQ